MKIKIDTENGNIKAVNMELNPIEFMLLRKILNLTCVYTELKESEIQTAGRMYKELDGQLKHTQRQQNPNG